MNVLFIVNPVPVLIMGLALQVLIEGKKMYNRERIWSLRNQVDNIRERIDSLKDNQEKLKYAQRDSLRQYILVKNQKSEFTQQVQRLRDELERPDEDIDLDSLAKELSKRKTAQKKASLSQVFTAFGIYGTMMSAQTKVNLELELLTSNTVIEPVFHPNGGVADFHLIIDGNTSLASTVYTNEKLAAMLEKWCGLTGQTPAHRLVNKAEEDNR